VFKAAPFLLNALPMAGDIFHNRGFDETLDVLFPWKHMSIAIIIIVRTMIQTVSIIA